MTDPRAPIAYGVAAVADDLPEDEFQALYGRIAPTSPVTIQELFVAVPFRWWVVGGWALELATREAREHVDLDVGVFTDELPAFRRWATEVGLDVWAPHPDGLLPVLPGSRLADDREQLWLRRSWNQAWLVDVLLTPRDGDRWVFKKDHRVTRDIDAAIRTSATGVEYLAPEIVLLHKAHIMREKDEIDFDATVPLLGDEARAWLRTSLTTAYPGHAWIDALG